MIQSTMVEIFCEGFVLAAKAGLKPQIMMEVIQGSMARARLTDFKAPFIFQGDFTPYFPLKLMHKDMALAMESAYAQNVPMPTAAAVKEVYGAAKAQGKGIWIMRPWSRFWRSWRRCRFGLASNVRGQLAA